MQKQVFVAFLMRYVFVVYLMMTRCILKLSRFLPSYLEILSLKMLSTQKLHHWNFRFTKINFLDRVFFFFLSEPPI